MKRALTTAILSKFTGDFYNSVGGRLFDGEAPEGEAFPFIVYQVISYTDISTFVEKTYQVQVQFSIFSTASSSREIKEIESALNASDVFDGQVFDFDGGTVLMMAFIQSDGPRRVEEDVEVGMPGYWQTDCDYEMIIEKES